MNLPPPLPHLPPSESGGAIRVQPIPVPSHPRQYRAIGLVYGQYRPCEEQLTRGVIFAADGITIESVLLGKVISLVKNHLDLDRSHLWVVYPRYRNDNDRLHLQIVGVWEPQTLSPSVVPSAVASPYSEPGYFSVRGEVVFTQPEQETVLVKIRQSPKKEGEKAKFFKVKLRGTLPGKPLGHFWDFQAQLQGDSIYIIEGLDLGSANKKKSSERRGNVKPSSRNSAPRPSKSRPIKPI